ncbi:mechanosensitive ion channel family protein [Intrasporangium oryzae]|nr:mechanosensitive ion channel family protein [Intrasporangium oryzae]
MPQVTWSEFGNWLVGTPLAIIVTILLAFVARWALLRVITRVVSTATSRHEARLAEQPKARHAVAVGVANERHVQRTRTLGALLRSTVTLTVFGVAALTILSILEIPLAPLLTSAGVGGIAIAFGAQSLVKDFISGIFMIIEDQYGVGDVIDTGEAIGTVEDISLRITQLRDGNGVTWYVRNGEILRVGNRSQGWSTAMVDIAIAWDEDVERARGIIRDVVAEMAEAPPWDDKLIEAPEVVGVESMTGGAITIRVVAKTVVQENAPVQREIRERVKIAFDREGVRSPAAFGSLPPGGEGRV